MNGLDIVFANHMTQRNRVCLNDGLAGSFTCDDVSTFTGFSDDVALRDVDAANGLDLVFAIAGSNRVCLNDGLSPPTFTCSNVSADSNNSGGVALGDLGGEVPIVAVPGLSLQGTLLAFLLLSLGGAVAGLSRR